MSEVLKNTPTAQPFVPPSHRLVGLTLIDEWKVVEKITKGDEQTGGQFSVGYIAERDGKSVFVKALDLSLAQKFGDFAQGLAHLTNLFVFERGMLEFCKESKMRRVVRALGEGTVEVDSTLPMGFGSVQYILFERADGDIRKQLEFDTHIDAAWKLRSLHNVAVGLQQLHYGGVAHQDIKPSNVLSFKHEGTKIADLGRASRRGVAGPVDALAMAGDKTYAPPELLYGFTPAEWADRRLGCDAYLFGSLIIFVFAKITLTQLLLGRLAIAQRPENWTGSFADVLPYLKKAFGSCMLDIGPAFPSEIREKLLEVVGQLCEPDPSVRGHPTSRAMAGKLHGIDRYVATFDLLAKKMEVQLK